MMNYLHNCQKVPLLVSKCLTLGGGKHGLLTASYMPRVRSRLGEPVLTLESDCDSTVPCMRPSEDVDEICFNSACTLLP